MILKIIKPRKWKGEHMNKFHVELKEFIAVSNQVQNESDVAYQAPGTWRVFPGSFALIKYSSIFWEDQGSSSLFFTNLILLEARKNHSGHTWPRACRKMGCGQIISVLWSCQWNLPVYQLSSHPIPHLLPSLSVLEAAWLVIPRPRKKKVVNMFTKNAL